MKRTILVLLLLVLGSWTEPLTAQDRGRECIRAYNNVVMRNPQVAQIDTMFPNGCQLVAVALEQQWRSTGFIAARPDPQDFAATRGQTTNIPGEAAPTVEPVEAAGGSLAAVGTNQGAGALAALAVNPSLFFLDPVDTEGLARWSRFTDFTVLVPVQQNGSDEQDSGSTEYIGIRWGINITGLAQGSELHRSVLAAYDTFNARSTPAIAAVRDLLMTASQLEPCIRVLTQRQTLAEVDRGTVTQLCGGFPVLDYGTTAEALRDAIHLARIRADSKYFGIDLRLDHGDLRLPAVDTSRGTALFAGVGAGRRFLFRNNATTGVRGHLGVRYWDREGDGGVFNAIEGGAAFEVIRYYNLQRLTLMGGIDFRHLRNAEDPRTVTFRAALNVPVAATTSVTVNYVAPVAGEQIGPTMSIKANWRLLWSGWL
jgi:hypothetical protein